MVNIDQYQVLGPCMLIQGDVRAFNTQGKHRLNMVIPVLDSEGVEMILPSH